MKKAIIGNGAFAREIYHHIKSDKPEIDLCFFVSDEYYTPSDNTFALSSLNVNEYEVIIGIGDPNIREKLVQSLPKETVYFSFVHSSARLLDASGIRLGQGVFIGAGSVLTTNISIGDHAQINLNCTIGHDCVIADYFTAAPGVNISGNCTIGKNVYIGTNSAIREKIQIVDNAVIGLNSGVVKNITTPGIYAGTPCLKIK